MKFIKQIFVVLALLCVNQVFAEPELGKDYKVLHSAQPAHAGNKIEVLEFFFYGCSHCFKMHPVLTAWEKKMPKDVELIFVPTIFNASWEPMARTYYTLELLGQEKRLHDDLFNAWNVNNIDLSDKAKIIDFVGQHGVDRKKFSDAYDSFTMQSKISRSKQLAKIYNIRGTPSLTVDGKYLISGLGPEESINVLNALIDKARKERAGKH
ncbi:MAG: thiol:disulfide interchange protein DsbA/DsbL [Candidatus Nitrotoga sp.]